MGESSQGNKWPRLQKVQQIAGWVFFGLGCFLTLFLLILFLFVSDRTWWGEYFTIWPPLLWLFVLMPLLVLSFDRRHWKRTVGLAGGILVFFLLTTEWTSVVFPGGEPGQPGTIRLVTWNISGNRRVLDELEALEPDICFLQETPDGQASFSDESLTGYWEGFAWYDAGDCGMLSRFPMEPVPMDYVGPWTPPQAATTVLPTSRTVLLVNVRLMLPSLVLNPLSQEGRRRLAEDNRVRREQFVEIARAIRAKADETGAEEIILAGDFNTPARMASVAPLEDFLRDAWLEAGRGRGATITASFPVARIDQVWVSEGIDPTAAWVEDTQASDHRILMTEIRSEE